MKKYFAITILVLSSVFQANAQSRGIKIGYIDMEYILQNVPDYSEAKSQLEQKAQKWKQDIEAKKVDIAKLKDALKTERALLTKELIDEREEEIKFQETELLDFQQKRFGPDGDLMTQKAVLVKPIQDQVFTAVQDIAEAKKYDYVFDKSSDLTMLFAAKRYDISDQVIRVITRAEKREQMTKKQVKEQEAKEALEDAVSDNPNLEARKKALEEKKKAREDLVAQRKAEAERKKAEKEAKRQELIDAKNGKKAGTVPAKEKTADETAAPTGENKASDSTAVADPKAEKAAARAKLLEERKKALEEKKQKALEAREAAKKAKEEKKQKTE
ncbi:OmpH family outer membrane protein [Flavobacterium wongokense]|uniref:OmpH family outer membrane protein n=1 Tax=Flavobacterium wongokense TaxID=2910674 RepID=UPI001F4054D0|nr:OmpH family outer membrane protein [Flavobacterium sp. WG47]MCF6131817.1 OmpH family outer membrane protein [Flavobacterium sp. WG47]